jgi:hypothetical protein
MAILTITEMDLSTARHAKLVHVIIIIIIGSLQRNLIHLAASVFLRRLWTVLGLDWAPTTKIPRSAVVAARHGFVALLVLGVRLLSDFPSVLQNWGGFCFRR